MARLEIRLLGSFEITLDGQPVLGIESDKVRALLAYLAVESDRAHRREKLAGLLWPDSTEELARTSLRHALSNLRTVIRDQEASRPVLDASVQTVRFDRGGDVWVDMLALQQHVADSRCLTGGGRHPPDAAVHLQAAVDLYRGSFLEGFSLADSSDFEEWALLEQEHLHHLVLEALHCLAEELEEQGDLEQALRQARRQVELEPWRESGHRQVMRLLARTGQRCAALAQYEACCRSLAKDLGAEPSVETVCLYQQIRDQADGLVRAGLAPPPAAAGPPLAERSGPKAEALPPRVVASAQPDRRSAGARPRPRAARLAAGAAALLAMAAVLALLASRTGGQVGLARDLIPTRLVVAQAGTAPSPTAGGRDAATAAPVPQPSASPSVSRAPTDSFPCRIAFASAEFSTTETLVHIYVMDRDGRQRTLLPGYDEGAEETRPLWLPDRQAILYERVVRSENAKSFSLWRMNPDGSGRQPLLGGSDARAASLSPEGTRLAFVAKRAGKYQVFTANLDGSQMVQITEAAWDSRRPSWSPDGQRLAFDAGEKGWSSIYIVGADGSGLEQLTEGTQDTDPAWSPDGRFIAFLSLRDGNLEVYVMNADGSAQTNVSNAPLADDRDVSWTPDAHLVFASDRDGDYEIYVMNRNGSHVVQLTRNDVNDHWPNWK